MRAIASGSGVSLATVHHYFGSKSGLYDAVIEAMYLDMSALKDTLLPQVLAAESPAQVVQIVIREGFRFTRSHQNSLRLLLRTVIDAGEFTTERRDQRLVPFLEEAGQVFSEMTEVPASEVRMLAQTMAFLATRYALTTTREMGLITGLLSNPEEGRELPHLEDKSAQGEQILKAVEDHLVALALRFLGLEESGDVS
jgi:AcrR family transcriptional regulator